MKEMKDKIKIIIGFSKPKNKIFPIFSWAIRAVERTEYSHVYTKWHSLGAGVDIYYQASGSSVHFSCKEVAESHLNPVHEYEVYISKESYKKLLKFCMSNAGKDYGVKQVFGIVYSKIMSAIKGEIIKNPFADGRRSQVCSELIGAMIEDVLDYKTNLDLDIAGPRAIKELLDEAPWATKIS